MIDVRTRSIASIARDSALATAPRMIARASAPRYPAGAFCRALLWFFPNRLEHDALGVGERPTRSESVDSDSWSFASRLSSQYLDSRLYVPSLSTASAHLLCASTAASASRFRFRSSSAFSSGDSSTAGRK
jgi:hypothetical protein